MGKFLLSALFMLISVAAFSTEYYSQGNGSANSLANWNSARNGTGSSPTNFLGANDVFIVQNGHLLSTSANWAVSGATAVLRIEDGSLTALHNIQVNRLELLDGGMYINNYAGMGALAANQLALSAASTVEIKNWVAGTLPTVNWGNLIISVTTSEPGGWTQANSIRNIQGDLIIRPDAAILVDISNAQPYNLAIDGSLLIESGTLVANWNVTFQISENLEISTAATLDLLQNAGLANVNLNVGKNIYNQGIVKSVGTGALINMSGAQVELEGNFEMGIRALPGSSISLSGDLEMASGFILVVAGELNAGTFNMNLNQSYLVVSGGALHASGVINSGNTAVCKGTGTLEPMSTFGYCSATGTVGEMHLSEALLQIPSGVGNRLVIGELNSPGKLFLSNFSVVEATGTGFPAVAIEVNKSSRLEFDAESVILGNANFTTTDAYMVIGSLDGIRSNLMGGNVQVSGARNYSNSAASVYEYISNDMQVTGNGLPGEMFGTIIINNTGDGITLSAPLTIKTGGVMNLNSGILQVAGTPTLTFEHNASLTGGSANAYVNGAISKIGSNNFIFHVGRDNIYSPVEMREISGAQPTDQFRVAYFPIKASTQFGGQIHEGELHHISSNDTWLIEKISGALNGEKRFYVRYTERSGVDNLESLTIAFLDGIYYRRLTNSVVNGTTASGTLSFVPLLYGPFTLGSRDMMNPLPVVLTNFTAEKAFGKALLKWNVTPDSNPEYFEILHAGADQQFTVNAKVNAVENLRDYSDLHHSPVAGDNFYQLRITDKEGVVTHSKIQKLNFEYAGNTLSLLPSYGYASNLIISSPEAATMKLQVTNINGQLIKAFDLRVQKGSNNFYLDMNSHPSGVYNVSVYDGNKLIETKRFIRK